MKLSNTISNSIPVHDEETVFPDY